MVDRRWVHPVGDIPLDEAALIEPLSVGHHAFVRSEAKAGDVALVTGVADHVIDPSQQDLAARVRQLTGGNGAEVSFECTSVNAALDQLMDAVRRIGLDDLVQDSFGTLIHHKDTAVKILVHP